jgi:uracil-DNA glycosylase
MNRIILLGSNPARCSSSLEPFADCQSGKILREEWLPKLGIGDCTIINVCNFPTFNNKPLSNTAIRGQIPRLLCLLQDNIVIALGKQALKAIELCKLQGLTCEVVTLPHPSRRNRINNDPIFVDKLLEEAKIKLATLIKSN